jgi:uncharacterized damage-inducible protein DinB
MAAHFERMWKFEAWANRRALESIAQLGEPAECLRLFGHILAAQRAWLTRLEGGDSSQVELFPTPTLEECEAGLAEMDRQGLAYLAGLGDDALDREIIYTNQTGKAFRNPPRDILTHLVMHSHYHRGQIAILVRQAGAMPAVTDFIAFCRLGR